MRGLRNIYNLGVKELRSLLGDKAMLTLIVFAFTVSVYSSATVTRWTQGWMPGAIPSPSIFRLIFNGMYWQEGSRICRLTSMPPV